MNWDFEAVFQVFIVKEMQSGFMKPFGLLQKRVGRQISTCDYQQLSFLIWKLGYKPLCNNATRTIFFTTTAQFLNWKCILVKINQDPNSNCICLTKTNWCFLQNSIAFEYLTDFLPFLPFLVRFMEFQTHVGPLDFWVLVILEV